MTMIDVMCLAAGVAMSFAISFRPGPIVEGPTYPMPWEMLMILVAWIFWVVAASTSVAVAARLVRYRRMPTPAEWLAIQMSVIVEQAMGLLQPIGILAGILPSGIVGPMETLLSWQWTTAALATAIVGLGLGLLRLVRGFLPPWARTAWLVVLAYLTLAGPIDTIKAEGVYLFVPPAIFGRGHLSMLFDEACQLIAVTPMALMPGIPAVAALIERVRRVRWRWTEWACTTASLLIVLAILLFHHSDFPFPSIDWAADRGLVGAWFLGVGFLSWAILDRLGPTWSRWLGDQTEDQGSTPIESSPASTFST
jgi:hypothetical protein